MNKITTHHLDLNKLFENILNKSIKITGAQSGYLFIFNESTNNFVLKAYSDLINNDIDYQNFLNDIINKILIKKQNIILTKNDIEKKYYKYNNISNYKLKSIMAVPIKIINRVIGVCYVENPFLKEVFNEEDAKLLTIFIDQTAIAIENANIFQNLRNEVKERTKELQLSNKMLLKLNNFKNEYIENISHDFKSPLTIILNITHNIINLEKELSCRTIDSLYLIHNASLQLQKSVDRLLELSKLEKESVNLKIKKVNPKEIIQKITNFYSASTLLNKIKIIKEIPPHKIIDFYTDKEMFENIINNIMSNAVKFTNKENGEIKIKLIDHKDKIIISIKDNGIGIPQNKLDTIFNRYEYSNSFNENSNGTGIGLAYVKQLVCYLNGKIFAESEGLNKGTNFILEFNKSSYYESNFEYQNAIAENKYS